MAQDPDKRHDKRASAAFTVSYRVLEPMAVRVRFGEAERDAVAEDLSVGGLSLSGDFLIPEGALLSIRFRVTQRGAADAEKGSQKFELRGEARYSHHTGQTHSYRTGVRFGRLTEAERRFIAESL